MYILNKGVKGLNKKILIGGSAIAVVVLVLASFSPVVGYKTLESEDEFVEVATEFCGLGKKHTVQLVATELEELKHLFTIIEKRLDNAKSIEEVVEIFNEAIEILNEYELLPKCMNVQQVQQLITGKFQNPRIGKLFERIGNIRNIGNDSRRSNLFCLIYANITDNYFALEANLLALLALLLDNSEIYELSQTNRYRIMNFASIHNEHYANISVNTFGLKGNKKFSVKHNQLFNMLWYNGLIIKYNYHGHYFDAIYLGHALSTAGPWDY
jgi:hypothetical protein